MAIVAGLSTATEAAAQAAGQPNIVVIMTDDQDDMGSMSRMAKVQSLLADNGVTFTNSFVDFPVCCPSRASFLTGQAAHNHGVQDNIAPLGGYETFMPTEGNALPVWLQQAGYTTAHIGKYLNGYGAGNVPPEHVPPGWDVWKGLPGSLGAHRYYSYTINEDGVLQAYGASPADYQTDVLAQKASQFIASQQGSGQPFFLSLAPLAPHVQELGVPLAVPAPRHDGLFAGLPLPQAPNYNEADVTDKPSFVSSLPLMDENDIMYTEEAYRKQAESLLAVEDLVETVVNSLQSSGGLDDTIIIYTSDNGFANGEHRRRSGKNLVYEESIRVPLVVRGPGIPSAQTRDQLVNNLDVVATILDYAQATPGRTLDGRSLKDLLENGGTPWRTALLVQGLYRSGLLGNPYGTYKAIRSADYVYAEHSSIVGLEEEFYALYSDPYQLTSRHDNPAYAAVMDDYRSLLAQLRSCSGETCWVASAVSSTQLLIETKDPDVDNNGTVDLFNDIFAVAGAFGSECGQPGYNEYYDFDSSCGIDLFLDIFLAAQGFGLTWPPADLEEGSSWPLRFFVHGIDPEDKPLTYSMSGLPSNASLDATTGEFSWTPTVAQSGAYSALFTVSDGATQASTSLPITVLDTH